MSFWGAFTPPSTPKFCWGWLIWAPNIAYESLLRWWKKKTSIWNFGAEIPFFGPKNTFFEGRGVLNPPRVPKFCRAWLIWSPTPACMSTLWFGKKIQPSYRIWFIFFIFLSHTLFFRVIWPIFGYPKPNIKSFFSHLEPATKFHKLAVDWAQNWPLFMSLDAICDFFPLHGSIWQIWPFFSTLSQVRYYWVSPTGPNAVFSCIIHLKGQSTKKVGR